MKNYTMLKMLRNEQRGSSKLARFLLYKSCANDCSVQCDSSVAVSMTLGESPSNHPVITQKSPSNHPVLSRKWLGNCSWMNRVWKYTAMLLMVLTFGVGEMWAADTYAIAGSFNDWSTTANKRTGTGTIDITFSSTGSYTFKIVKNSSWCGNSGTMTRDNCSGWAFNADANCTISIDKTGTYTFNITNSTPTLSVTYPAATWSVAGGMNSWSTTANTFSDNKVSIDLTTETTTEFKIYRKEGNKYYGNSGTMTSSNCTNWDFNSDNNAKITANITGTYVFELVNTTPRITVHYPVAISYNKGTNGTGTISGGVKTYGYNYTLSSSTFTRDGYTQDGWSTSDGGSKAYNLGGTYSTHTAQTFYPHWVENTYTVTVNNDGNGTTDPSGAQSNVGQVTGIAISASENDGYEFTNWTIVSGTGTFTGGGTTSTSSSTRFYPTSAATIRANFSSAATSTLTVTATAGGTITTPAAGYYSDITETSYDIVASRSEGYKFTGWSKTAGDGAVSFGSASSLSTTATITTLGDVTVTAGFAQMTNGLSVSSSTLYAGDNITLTATRTNHSLNLTYQYKVGDGAWTDIATQSGTSKTWQIPYANTYQTYKFRVKSTDGSTSFYSSEQTVNVKGRITIHVKNTNSWGSVYLYSWYSSTETNGSWPGKTGTGLNNQSCSVHATGSQWWDITITQETAIAQTFILNCNTSGNQYQTNDLTLSDLSHDAYYAMSTESSSKQSLSTTTTPAAPTVTDLAASTVRETSATLGGKINATADLGNDIISERGYYWSTNSALSSSNLAVGTKVTVSGTQSATGNFTSSKSGLTAGTKYYFIAYAKNGYGTGYSSVLNFTTLNTYTVTVATESASKGTVSPSSVTVGQYKNATITATPLVGYKFSSWTPSSNKVTVASTSDKSTTVTATATGSVTANFARTYAFMEGRFHITNADRDGTWTNTFEDGDADAWDIESTRIPFEYDNTNHLFYLRTYATPKELTTNISDIAPYFFIKVSSSSSSLTGVTTYRPYSGADSNRKLTTAGDSYKKATVTSSNDHSYQFSSEDESGYVKLYFNQSHIWYWLEQTLEYDANGGTGDAPAKTYHDKGTNATAASNTFTRDGYTFSGWKTAPNSGTSYSAGASVTMNSNITLYAQWAANDYTITLDQQTSATGYSASGTASVPTVTYNAVLPAISGTMPTTTGYYGFMGFYTEENGEGERLTDGTGAWIASVDGYTDADKKWIYPGDKTLYAYYRTATIGSISLGGETAFAQNTSVTATATIEPTPVSTTIICWRLLHYNNNPVDPQPTFTPASGTSVTFTTPEASGMYKIEATLRTGSSCGAGDELGSNTQSFQVAGEHTVTIQYMCGDVTLKEPVSMTGRPLSWSDEITAPEIFGYTFTRWTAEDGVTITDDDGETTKTTTTEADIKVKATYDGRLTAVYTQKSLIFFKNTLEWEQVYVNFLSEWGYWNNPKGSGNKDVTYRNKAMTQIGETDVWYYDYGADEITPSMYVSFTEDEQESDGNGYLNFWKASPGENVVYPANYADDINTDKSSETGFKATTPMFVPLAGQTPVELNKGGDGWANYYNSGYWTTYTSGTGYTLEVYNSDGTVLEKSIAFTSSDDLMPMSATVDLESGIPYKFQIRRGGTGDNGVYYGNGGTMTYTDHGQDVAWDLGNSSFSMCGLTTNASGDYTFNLSYSPYNDSYYRLRIAVDYPVATGDYRLIYTDTKPTCKPSAIVPLVNNGKDTVSFFVRKASSPSLRIQKATVANDGTITWAEYPTPGTPTNQITGAIATAITQDSVYNFCLEMNGSGALTVVKAEAYTGSYYIRTDCANSKWDNYRSDRDHLMTYSDYAEKKEGFSHYYTHWVDYTTSGRKNVKFCIANDYSPSISDTLTRETASGVWANITNYITEGGDLRRNANVRFMWNRHNNTISRAYVDGAQEDDSHFLQILSSDSKIKNAAGDAVLTEVTFTDKGNWLYEAKIKTQPNAGIKLKSTWGEENTIEQYFKGSSSSTATLLGGSGEKWYDIRLIYDFKTNRLVTAYLPSGTLSEDLEIHADIMFLREHQGDVTQIDFTGGAKISEIETVYSVLQFNMWTLNNRSKTSGHALLSPLLSRYERDLFYVSFPYDVKLSDVIGFGTYGKHWIIEYYDGAGRAASGFWSDSPSFWKFVTPAMKGSFTLKAGTGYIVALDLDELWWKANDDKADVWKNTDVVELLFPGNVASISSTSVKYTMPEHTCTINRGTADGNRTIKDSHWNVLGVPTYHNLTSAGVSAPNTTWIAQCPEYIYTWNMQDNTLTATAASGFEYQAMHAYMVQYYGDVTFTSSSSPVPASIARRANSQEPSEVEFRIELQQNDESIDQTFVKLSNDEQVSTDFAFGEDMSKEFNKNKANIYTFIGSEQAAGNTLPMSEQTTIVPVGVKLATDGDYTFTMPDGTNGVGVTLIDSYNGTHTNLSALDYTVSLEAGTYDDRFLLQISPIHTVTTDVETSDIRDQKSDVRKLLIDGLMYIVREGKMYDARGARVE